MKSVDVAIIGAGAAGLAAAHALRGHGMSLVVFEARERVGGRILTDRDPRTNLPVELGAEFIHGSAPLTEGLLRHAGLTSHDVGGEHRAAERGRLRRAEFLGAIDRVMHHADPDSADLSAAAFLARRPGGPSLARARGVTRRFLEGFHAADLRQLSVLAVTPAEGESLTEAAGRLGRVDQGYAGITHWLARDLRSSLRLGHVVRAVEWRPGRATLTVLRRSRASTRCGARAVIVTVPLGVLKAPPSARGAIAFEPRPQRVERALAGLAMGSAVRLCVAFRRPPWDRDGFVAASAGTERLSFLHLAGTRFQVCWTAYPHRAPLAVAWCGGPAATALSSAGRAQVLDAVRSDLARALRTTPGRIEGSVRRVWWHNWDQDPYARGAYSYVRVGGGAASRTLARPQEGTLFFAGEATDPQGGTVEAALASGRRAARQVLSLLATD